MKEIAKKYIEHKSGQEAAHDYIINNIAKNKHKIAKKIPCNVNHMQILISENCLDVGFVHTLKNYERKFASFYFDKKMCEWRIDLQNKTIENEAFYDFMLDFLNNGDE